MKSYRPCKNGLWTARVILILFAALLVFLANRFLNRYGLIMHIAIGLAVSVVFILCTIILPLLFSKTRYYIGREEIRKLSGIFFTRTGYMRLKSMQYVTMTALPFSWLTGLNFVSVCALGGKMSFLFLDLEDAVQIMSLINKGIEESYNDD